MSTVWRYRVAVACSALLAVSLAAIDGCRPSAGPASGPSGALGDEPAASAVPGWLATPLAASAPALAPEPPVEPLPATVVDPDKPHFEPAAIIPVLDEPRLEKVRAAVKRDAFKKAADKLAVKVRALSSDSGDKERWGYQLGVLRARAGQVGAAIAAFEQAAATEWALRDYARFRAAELLVRTGEPTRALGHLAAVAPGLGNDDAVSLTRARALAATRRVDEAAPIWRDYLARQPREKGWPKVALRYAAALLNEPTTAHAEEAVAVARQVIYESPAGRGVGEAREFERRGLATMPYARRKKLLRAEVEELAQRARGLADARQGREAIAAAEKLIEALGEKQSGAIAEPSQYSCEAHLAKAKGLATIRKYRKSSRVYEQAIRQCRGLPRQVYAFFLGGRSALRTGKPALARQRYALLEQQFPSHRFADDARLHGAEAALKLGDVAGFTRMLATVEADYPEGDMVDQALFTQARALIDRDDWAGSIRPLKRAIARKVRGRPYWADGRPQYFLARAYLETGRRQQGLAELAAVIEKFPLSYYMVLAYARLSHHDAARAGRTLREAMMSEPRGDMVIAAHPELQRPEFLRAVALVRQGDGKRARAELNLLGLNKEGAPPSLVWASAFLLARTDATLESHGVLRHSNQQWTAHYPAGIWQSLWKIAFPRPYARIVKREVKRARIPESLAYAIMREESAFSPGVVSTARAHGLMQLTVPTVRGLKSSPNRRASAAALKRPTINIELGCRLLSILVRRFKHAPLLAVPSYNAGPGATNRWLRKRSDDDFDLFVERIPYRETRRYTKRVIRSMAAYATLYGDGMQARLLKLPLELEPRP